MKHITHMLAAVLGIALGLTSCSKGDTYEYIYLREVTVDNIDADEELVATATTTLETTGLPVLTREQMRELTPQQRLRTLKVKIDIDCRRNKVDADLDIENLQTDRDVWETGCKVSNETPDAVGTALATVLDDAVTYIKGL